MGKAGRPSDLTKELLAEIKQSILNGNNLKTTAKICGIKESTLYRWHSDNYASISDNYASISDKIEGWKRDYKLNLAHKKDREAVETRAD